MTSEAHNNILPITDGFYRQVKQISGAHMKPERYTPQTKKRRGMAPPVVSQLIFP